jgi:thymidylate synthase
MNQYLSDLKYILENGKVREDRTGTGTIGVFGMQTRYNLRESFPAPTTKKLAWKGVVSELLWFLEGSSDERRLAEIRYEKPASELIGKNTIWTENADNQGVALGYPNTNTEKSLGPVYGYQWRNWQNVDLETFDQIEILIQGLKTNPNSRRHILSAWNVGEIDYMALPPCHCLAQFHVQDGELSCQLYQRSADFFLGVPFNIASYALLTHMLAQICDLKVGDFIHTIGDAHIYSNHVEQVTEQLSRSTIPGPKLVMPKFNTLNELLKTKTSDYILDNYTPMPSIKAPMAI